MSDILKIESNVQILNTTEDKYKYIVNNQLLLNPITHYNGMKTLQINAENTLVGNDCNTVMLCSVNSVPFSLILNESENILTNLYCWFYCGDSINFEIYNESVDTECQVNFVIGVTAILGNSYIYT